MTLARTQTLAGAQAGYVPDSRTLNPPGPLPTHEAANRITEVLADLDSALGALACRLDPVLSVTTAAPLDAPELALSGSAPLTQQLNDNVNRIIRLAATVREISNRLEV